MFRDAIEGAMHYTQPVVSFWKTAEGECKTGVAACVVINQDGWIVTAAHVVQHAIALSQAESEARSWESQRDQARADQTISAKERSKRLSALGKRAKDTVVRSATSWGFHSGGLANISIIPEIDLAVGQLQPFDPSWVNCYPTFKDPTKDFRAGASLCKLGFPFLDIKANYDEAVNSFSVPPEMQVLPFFPMEGIFTRTLNQPQSQWAFPLQFVETSSPGLRGQSGGPTFDKNGAIWAIQSMTSHQQLGFSPEIRMNGQNHKEHQFLNVGMGIHAATILGFLNQLGIIYTLSAN